MFSYTWFFLLALHFLPNISDGQEAEHFFREDYTYMEETQSFYKFHTNNFFYQSAKFTCSLEGASLFYPENDAEARIAETIWKKAHSSADWLLVGRIEKNGTLTIDDGKYIENIGSVSNKWISGEPPKWDSLNNAVVINHDGLMKTVHWYGNFSFMCKKKLEKKYSCIERHLDLEKSKHREDYIYREATQGFYKFHKNPLTWSEAKRMCALEGASLFHPKDDNEAKEVLSFWKNTEPAIKWIYLGLSDLISEGTFVTVNGDNIADVYSNWKAGQPDDFRKREDCVLMSDDGLMNDIVCSDRNRFICKKNMQTVEWNHSCNMYNLDYKSNEETGKCYKLHTVPMDWNGANSVCGAELTHLVVINDQQEADYLAKLVESTLARKIGGNYIRGIFHVGFSKQPHGGWTTVKGTPLNTNATLWWGGSVPDDRDSQQCGAMFYTGRLSPVDCSVRSMFVCEHEINN